MPKELVISSFFLYNVIVGCDHKKSIMINISLGAHGYFEVTNDISHYSLAKLFSPVGSQTPISVRFSQVAGEMGYPDSTR